jgi:catalase
VHHYRKDGSMNFFGQKTGAVDAYYEPNSMGGATEDPSVMEPPLKISGDAARYNHRDGNDDYSQPRALHDLMTDDQRARLYMNTAESMQGVPQHIIDRALANYDKVSPAYGDGIRAALRELAGARAAAE